MFRFTHATRKARWFQFSLRTLLLLSLLYAIGWWWAAWPQRTAAKYRESVLYGSPEQARAFLAASCDPDPETFFDEKHFQQALRDGCRPERRSAMDFLLGRQSFALDGPYGNFCGFTIQRSRVIAINGYTVYLFPSEFSIPRNTGRDAGMEPTRDESEDAP